MMKLRIASCVLLYCLVGLCPAMCMAYESLGDFTEAVVTMRVADEMTWSSVSEALSISDVSEAIDDVVARDKWNSYRMILFEVVYNCDGKGSSEFIELIRAHPELFERYRRYLEGTMDPNYFSHMPSNTTYHELMAIRSYLISTTDSESTKVDNIAGLVLARQEFVNLKSLVWFLGIVDPEFAFAVSLSVINQAPEYVPHYPYNSHYSMIVGLASNIDSDLDFENLREKVLMNHVLPCVKRRNWDWVESELRSDSED